MVTSRQVPFLDIESIIASQGLCNPQGTLDLGVDDPENCDIDGIAPIYEMATDWMLLFTTDDEHPCGLDPGDIYVTNTAGWWGLYADDVNDLKIASSEDDPVDIDALAVNTEGDIDPGDPYKPRDPSFYKADWPNYAPSGMPDFSQYHNDPETGGAWPPTYCGPVAIWNSLWSLKLRLEPGTSAREPSRR